MAARFQTDTTKLIEHVRRANFYLVFVCALVFLTARSIPPLPEPPLEELTELVQLFNVRGAFLDVKKTLLATHLTKVRILLLGEPPEKFFLHYYPLVSTDLDSESETLRDLRDRWDALLNLPVHDIAAFAPYALEGDEWKPIRVVLPSEGIDVPPFGLPTGRSRRFESFTHVARARALAESLTIPAHLADTPPEAAIRVRSWGEPIVLFFSVEKAPLEGAPVLGQTLGAASGASFRTPLTEFGDYFPTVQKHFDEVADLPLDEAFSRLESIAEQARETTLAQLDTEPPIRLFGLEIPRTDVLAYGSVLVILVQLYFFLHVSALARSIVAAPPDLLAPWIGLYDARIARATFLLSIAAPPLAAQLMTLTAALPLGFIEKTPWLVYTIGSLIVSCIFTVAAIVATTRIWKTGSSGLIADEVAD